MRSHEFVPINSSEPLLKSCEFICLCKVEIFAYLIYLILVLLLRLEGEWWRASHIINLDRFNNAWIHYGLFLFFRSLLLLFFLFTLFGCRLLLLFLISYVKIFLLLKHFESIFTAKVFFVAPVIYIWWLVNARPLWMNLVTISVSNVWLLYITFHFLYYTDWARLLFDLHLNRIRVILP